uniref:RING-type E3 ubiquitin transferase n=1 Tax=Oryza punctata TaxID=4537 RepID=A0A0E0LR32_ORYPU
MEVSSEQGSTWPDDFRCPISLEVMTDPVILPSGHTFERRSIQRWLDGGHLTCPVTNLPLPPSPPLIPNHALRRLIAAVSPVAAVAAAAAPAAAGGGERREVVSSVYGLLRLARSGPEGRREVMESGDVGVLLRHAAGGDEVAARAVLHLSLDGDDARVGLVADGAVDALSAAVSSGGAAAAVAATALTSLATVDVNKCTIGAHPSAIPALVGLLRRGSGGGARERREAATALYELCKLPENRRRAVRAGAAPALVDLAAAGSARAAEVLGLFAKSREGRHELSRIPRIVAVLIGVAGSGNARAIEQALIVLNLICGDSNDLAREAIKLGAFHLCEALVNDDNCKIAKNAVELARTLEKL